MPVGLVLIAPDFEVRSRGSALYIDGIRLAALFRENPRECQFAELELPLHPEQALRSLYQTVGSGQADIAQFDLLDDVVFLTFELQLHGVLKGEGGLGVVVGLQFQAFADLPCDIHLNALIEVEVEDLLIHHRKVGVLDPLKAQTEGQFCRSLRRDLDHIRSKDRGEKTAVHIDVRDQTLHIRSSIRVFCRCSKSIVNRAGTRACFAAPVVAHLLVKNKSPILFGRHQHGWRDDQVTDLPRHHILAGHRVVEHIERAGRFQEQTAALPTRKWIGEVL